MAVAGVDLQNVADGHVGGHLDGGAGLQRGGLGGVGGGVALEARLGLGDLKLDEHLRLDADQLVAGVQQRCLVVFLQPLGSIAHRLGGNGHLLVGVVVHQPEVGTVVVQVLQLLGLKTHGVEFGARVEGVVHHAAGADVLELGAHERTALAGLHMLELNDGPQLVVVIDAHAVLEVGGGDCHACYSFQTTGRTPRARLRAKPLQYNHLMRGFREDIETVGSDHAEILQAHAELSRQIYARLHRDDVAFDKRLVVAR